jgi:hypothetical protein
VIASYEHSGLFGPVVSNEGKEFYNIDTCSRTLDAEYSKPLRLLSNTTDLVYDITNTSESVNQWILMTHFEFLQNRSDAKMRNVFFTRRNDIHYSDAQLDCLIATRSINDNLH